MNAQRRLQGGRLFDLGVGETADFQGHSVKVVALTEPRNAVRGVIRFPSATVEIDGERAGVPVGLYHLPQWQPSPVLSGLGKAADQSAVIVQSQMLRFVAETWRVGLAGVPRADRHVWRTLPNAAAPPPL